MNSRRRGPLAACAAPVLVTIIALGSLLTGVHATRADTTTVDPQTSIHVTMGTLTPIAPQPGQSLTITGTLTNVSDETISNISYQLLVNQYFNSRGEFQAYAQGSGDPVDSYYGGQAAVPAAEPTLAPGAQEPYTLTIDDVSTLNLPTTGVVYPMAVGVTGDDDTGYSGPVGQLRTFLPWAPRGVEPGASTSLAWVIPLIDRPHRSADRDWYNDDLAAELAPTGRLGGLLNAGATAGRQPAAGAASTTQTVAITWAIDPMLLAEVQAMAAGYTVTLPPASADPNPTTPGTGAKIAKAWLDKLRRVVQRPGAEVIALPYADPDVVAALRAGLRQDLQILTTERSDVAKALPGADVQQIAWPPGGFINAQAANYLSETSPPTSLLLDPRALPVAGPPPSGETPSAHVQFQTPSSDGSIDALLSDQGLDLDVNGGAGNPAGLRAAVQQFAAETLMIHSEDPRDARWLVVTPNRHWNPPATYAAQLLAATAQLPWLTPVGLSAIEASPVGALPRQPLTYPASAQAQELPRTYLRRVAALESDIAAYRAILLPPDSTMTTNFTTAALESLSAAWRDNPHLANRRLAALTTAVHQQMSMVHISTKNGSSVTLTSHGGRIPVTVANDLDTPVTVKVKLLPNARLTGTEGSTATVTIQANTLKLVNLHATAKTSGTFPLKVQLATLQGQLYGKPVPLFVKSTIYGTITLLITGIATAALVIAVVIRLSRRALAARRSAGGLL